MLFSKKSSSQKNDMHRSSASSSGSFHTQSADNTTILSMLAKDYLKEKQSRRRWGIFLKLIVLTYIGMTAYIYYFNTESKAMSGRHAAFVELNGLIGLNNITANQINTSLKNAFESKFSVGVILDINSPGGSPVQSAQINEEITRLKLLYPEKPFYVTISDVCASGGYYIAAAADEIYAHPSSIVGSIGVLMNGFGFVDLMEKLGIERRLITAGKNKGILDPFSPLDLEQEKHAKLILDEVHQQFISTVKKGRGERLKVSYPDLFSGLFWSGEKAQQLGLIDGFGSVDTVSRDILKVEMLVNYTLQPTLFERFVEEIVVVITNTIGIQFMNIRSPFWIQ